MNLLLRLRLVAYHVCYIFHFSTFLHNCPLEEAFSFSLCLFHSIVALLSFLFFFPLEDALPQSAAKTAVDEKLRRRTQRGDQQRDLSAFAVCSVHRFAKKEAEKWLISPPSKIIYCNIKSRHNQIICVSTKALLRFFSIHLPNPIPFSQAAALRRRRGRKE